jgi:hypothetical protein
LKTDNPFATMITNLLKNCTMKTLKAIKTIFVILSLLALPAVAKAQETSRIVETGAFTGINAGSIINIELVRGDQYSVEIIADSKVMDDIEVNVRNGMLTLGYSGSSRNAKATVTIVTPTIERIKLSGASNLTSSTPFEAPSMKFDLSGASSATMTVNAAAIETSLSGASNLRLNGQTERHKASVSGASTLRAQQLLTQVTEVKASGASSARVNATQMLNANASGSSKVEYTEAPAHLEMKSTGVGSVSGPRAASVSDMSDTTRIRVGGRDVMVINENERQVKRTKRRSFRSNWAGLDIGVNGYMAPGQRINLQPEAEPIDLRYERSFVYGLNLFQQNLPLISNNLGLYTGVGITWNNYRFDNQTRLMKDNEGVYFVQDTVNKIVRNKINLTYINVPFMLELQTGGNRRTERFHIAGGVVVGARVGTNVKYRYDNDGKKRNEKVFDDFAIHPFKFDLAARMGWGRINLFATYALNTLFKEGKGPELYPFTVGLQLISF